MNQELLTDIREIHKERKGIYGYRLMRLAGIQSVIRRKKTLFAIHSAVRGREHPEPGIPRGQTESEMGHGRHGVQVRY